MHLAISDPTDDSAIFEYVNGKPFDFAPLGSRYEAPKK